MSHIQFLILVFFTSSGRLAWTQNDTYSEFTQYITFKDSNGVTKYLDLGSYNSSLETRRTGLHFGQYFLYTRNNPNSAQLLNPDDPSTILASYFNPSVPTIVIVHGWLGHGGSDLNIDIRIACLVKSNVNVIVLDWNQVAIGGYVSVTFQVPCIGLELGRFLAILNSVTGVPFSSMHLIGHSLGAHVVGNAGRELGGKVARLTGLDPAGPLWGYNKYRLRYTDGVYVEVIHTNGGVLGMASAIGDTDFYPNGGTSQPGCDNDICNHSYAWQLFAASVTHDKFFGCKCNSLQSKCTYNRLTMGNNNLKKRGVGTYWLQTTENYPYYEMLVT